MSFFKFRKKEKNAFAIERKCYIIYISVSAAAKYYAMLSKQNM